MTQSYNEKFPFNKMGIMAEGGDNDEDDIFSIDDINILIRNIQKTFLQEIKSKSRRGGLAKLLKMSRGF